MNKTELEYLVNRIIKLETELAELKENNEISSGISTESRRRLDQIDNLIEQMLEQADGKLVSIEDIINQGCILEDQGINKNHIIRAIEEMTKRGILVELERGHVKKP